MNHRIISIKKSGIAPVKKKTRADYSERREKSERTRKKIKEIDLKKEKSGTRSMKMNDILIYFDKKYKGKWQDIFNAINRKEKPPQDVTDIADKELEKYDIVTLIDSDYPNDLKYRYQPPFVIKRKKGSKGEYKDEEIR